MKESNFIKKNLESWKEFEDAISLKEDKPRKLNRLFVKVTDDLSHAYTFYNSRSVRVYLNSVARQLFNKVNHSERFRFSTVRRFYTESVPQAIYQARREFYIAFALFSVSMLIGILSSKYNPEFAQIILGDDYISMTNANIEKNDPMAVYKSQAPFDMFLGITVNNCLVALRTFLLGIFMAVGTIVIMLYNGIMVGTFQYFFVERDLFAESFLTIWQHGVFEISSIIMSGAAGLVLGRGLVFPGNYSRFQSLRMSARRGLKLMLGIIPILVVAGFIEGFYTRFTDAPTFLRVLTILISFAFIIGYFIILPRRKHRKSNPDTPVERKIELTDNEDLDIRKIYTEAEVFMFTFNQLKNNFWKILKWVFVVATLFSLGLFLMEQMGMTDTNSENYTNFSARWVMLGSVEVISLFMFCFLFLSLRLNYLFPSSLYEEEQKRPLLLWSINSLVILLLAHLVFFIKNPFFAFLLFSLVMPFVVLFVNSFKMENAGFFKSTQHALQYLKGRGNMGKLLLLALKFILLTILFYVFFGKVIRPFNDALLEWNINSEEEGHSAIIYFVNAFYFGFIMFFAYGLMYLGTNILYYTLYESFSAGNLKDRIAQIGNTKRIRGLIRE